MKTKLYLTQILERKQAGFFILIDPDKTPIEILSNRVEAGIRAGVDAFLVGGSLLHTADFDNYVQELKQNSLDRPVIIFPGDVNQVSGKADAILFLSLLSGRNPQHLIGSQVMAAPIIRRLQLETLSTAYLLVESGRPTSAEFISGTRPLPRHKIDIAVAHALAAQYLGFEYIYLEAGSGAELPVPVEMILAISRVVDIPLIVGGGIKSADEAAERIAAGASFIVTGNVLEQQTDDQFLLHLGRVFL